MADISKIKLADGTTVALKDATGRSLISAAEASLAAETSARISADAALSAAIAAETSARASADSAFDTRVKALESKGRYLSTWDSTTGLPETYPQDSQFVSGKYMYKAGDYYIVNKVAASGSTNYMPDGTYITKEGTTYTVPKKAYTGTLNLGDQFQFDGTSWQHIASATTVAFANIQGDAEENGNLKGKLDAKLDKATATVAGVKFDTSTQNVPTASL